MLPCLQQTADGVVISLRVQPRSSKNQLVGLVDDALKIKLTSPPVDGVANRACCAYLAKLFGIAKSRVELLSGDKARTKRLLLRDLSLLEVERTLSVSLAPTA